MKVVLEQYVDNGKTFYKIGQTHIGGVKNAINVCPYYAFGYILSVTIFCSQTPLLTIKYPIITLINSVNCTRKKIKVMGSAV